MSGAGLPELLALVLALGMNAYVLLGGADFGGGVWDLLARGPRRDAQRDAIVHAIGPIWEANHVWLIVVIVVLFTAFPPVFAALGTLLHVPLALMLVGIVLRGSAFVFRSYGIGGSVAERRWGRVFAIASLVTPFFLGIVVGAIASGSVGRAAVLAAGSAPGSVSFREIYVAPWFSGFGIAVGCLAVALFAFLAAVYLTIAARDPGVREDFRRAALGGAGAVFVIAFGTLAVAHVAAPEVRASLTGSSWALPFQLATGVSAVAAVFFLVRRRWALARIAAVAQVSLILWGWVFSQYPLLIPPHVSIRDAAAPPVTLRLLGLVLALGALVLVPSLVYLFRTFSAEPREGKGAARRS